MRKEDFDTFINGVGNDLKIAIDDIISAILIIYSDVEKLKVKNSKPDKEKAQALLYYINIEDPEVRKNIERFCAKELEQYFRWIDDYCNQHTCTREQALNLIIDDKL